MSPPECPVCGEAAVVEDSHGANACKVCAECGYVLSDVTLTSEHQTYVSDPIRGASVALTMALKRTVSDPSGLIESLKFIKGLGKSMTFCEAMIEQASNSFRQLYKHDKLHFKSMELKQAMGACCVYIVARSSNYPVTIREILRISGVSLVLFARAYKLGKVSLNMSTTTTPSIGHVCAQIFALHRLPKSLLDPTQQLLLICDKVWITFSSFNKENVVAMCSFIAWQADNRNEKIKTDCKAFCDKFSFSKQRVFRHHMFHRIQQLILSLAKKLPWLGNQMTLKTIPWYLEDILEYKHSLVKKTFGQCSSDESGNENVETVLLPPRKRSRHNDHIVLQEMIRGEQQVEQFKKLHGSLDNPEVTETEFEDEINNLIK